MRIVDELPGSNALYIFDGYRSGKSDPWDYGRCIYYDHHAHVFDHDGCVDYGKADIEVMRAVLHARQFLKSRSIEENHEAVIEYREYLLRKIANNRFDEFERKTIKQKYWS